MSRQTDSPGTVFPPDWNLVLLDLQECQIKNLEKNIVTFSNVKLNSERKTVQRLSNLPTEGVAFDCYLRVESHVNTVTTKLFLKFMFLNHPHLPSKTKVLLQVLLPET